MKSSTILRAAAVRVANTRVRYSCIAINKAAKGMNEIPLVARHHYEAFVGDRPRVGHFEKECPEDPFGSFDVPRSRAKTHRILAMLFTALQAEEDGD